MITINDDVSDNNYAAADAEYNDDDNDD